MRAATDRRAWGERAWSEQIREFAELVRRSVPAGRLLSDEVWQRRHTVIVAILAAHVPAIVIFSVAVGESLLHGIMEAAIVVAAAGIAAFRPLGRTVRSMAACAGLLTASAIFVHLSGGYIELHFHFFVMVALMGLYQEWMPFLLAIGYVVFHHGLIGIVYPEHVFNHAAGQQNPVFWALVHGGFILALSAVSLVSWSHAHRLALVDPLTALANRRLFSEVMTRAMRAERRRGPSAVLFIDLDDFKHVNDSLGHAAGDALLTQVGARLSAVVRSDDTVARLGGDEFAILLPDTPVDSARRVAQRALEALDTPFDYDGRIVYLRGTIGIACSGPEADDPETVLRNADMAMYDGKAAGKDRATLFRPELHANHLKRLEFEGELRRAVTGGELRLHYQPILHLTTGRVSAYEALVRWQHPDRGLLSPADFIPLAEESALIMGIDRWVLHEACRQFRLWQDQPGWPSDVGITVNVSARELRTSTFVDEVATVLNDTGLAPRNLTIEMTEGVLIIDTELAVGQIEALKRLGVRIAIDDFGSGYSSLRYLQRFPVDILKIDRAFVAAIHQGAAGSAVMEAALAIGASLGIKTVAEGVEHRDQLERLQQMGCTLAQGFHFSRPLTPDAAAAYLEQSERRVRQESRAREGGRGSAVLGAASASGARPQPL